MCYRELPIHQGDRRGGFIRPCDRDRSFAADERGTVVMLVLVWFLFLALFVGMSIDFVRHDRERADLQNGLDRGVLAAANLANDVATAADAKVVIEEYMVSRAHPSRSPKVEVKRFTAGMGRSISASADVDLEATFLNMAGISELLVPTRSAAAQAFGITEIVLVLDVSYSMTDPSNVNPGNTKLDDVKEAAKNFVEQALSDRNNQVLISIVPYSSQVNLPDFMADLYITESDHDYSNCIKYSGYMGNWNNTSFSIEVDRTQYQHFFDNYIDGKAVYGCPASNNAIFPFSNDKVALKAMIEGMTPENWTASYYGMRWAATLLDPSARAVVDTMISNGDLSVGFSGWPRDWDGARTKKVVVLMSDGNNTRSQYIDEDAYERWGANIFGNPFALELLYYYFGIDLYRHKKVRIDDEEGGATRKDVNGVDRTYGDSFTVDMCEAVKTNEQAIVYTIGFNIEKGSDADKVLSTCATSPTTYYYVKDLDIASAFANIATELSTLALTE
ncbi:MAG: pilus assembly protein TadG-related protein [Paracoccaceae bacterium]